MGKPIEQPQEKSHELYGVYYDYSKLIPDLLKSHNNFEIIHENCNFKQTELDYANTCFNDKDKKNQLSTQSVIPKKNHQKMITMSNHNDSKYNKCFDYTTLTNLPNKYKSVIVQEFFYKEIIYEKILFGNSL